MLKIIKFDGELHTETEQEKLIYIKEEDPNEESEGSEMEASENILPSLVKHDDDKV